MNNFLVAVAVVLIAALAALFAVPRAVNWDNYRGVIEEEATRLLSRDVRVGGRVKVRLLPTPSFSVEQIRVADTEANSGEPFFRAEALKGRLSIAPLFRGVLEANQMVLSKPLLHLVLDGEGGGNWKTLGQGTGRLSFMPTEVALQAVKIEGGVLGIYGPDKSERLRLESIDGELSAQALDGPFRFRGFFGTDQARRELRLSTTKQEADGGIRFKALLKQLESGSSFAFDARAIDLGRSPRLEGELTAQVPLPQLSAPQAATGAKSEPEAPVEVKAALSADLKSVKLANLTLAFERFGRPQILTGEAVVDLAQAVDMRAVLAAKWLDLDQLTGASPVPGTDASALPTQGPIAGMLTLARRLNGFNPEVGRASLTLDVEQANLGREPVSGLRLVLQGQGAETEIQELQIGLPGGARADVKGLMTGSGEETAFAGDMVLRGSSLARFLGWSSSGGIVLDPGRDGPFAMRTRLSAAPDGVVAREFVGELAGTIMQGELGYRWQGRPEISVLVEGPQIDLRAVLPERGAGAGSLLSYLSAGAALGSQSTTMDAVLRLRAGQLLVPGASYQDAAADIELKDGRVRVRQLRLVAANGVTLDVEGDVPTLAAQPRGTLRGVVSATDVTGLAVLADLVAVPANLLPEPNRRSSLVPLRMAGVVTFGLGPKAPFDVTADGDVADTRVRIKAHLNQGIEGWLTAPLDVTARLDGLGAETLARTLVSPTQLSVAAGSPAQLKSASSIALTAAGAWSAGLVTRVSLVSGTGNAEFAGQFAHDAGPDVALSVSTISAAGDVRVAVSDSAILARYFPALSRLRLDGVAMAGTARIESTRVGTKLSRINGKLADTSLRGELRATDQGAVTHITGEIETSGFAVASALRPLLLQRSVASAASADAASDWLATDWPVQPFDLRAINAVTADVVVRADHLALPGGARLQRAHFVVALSPNRFELRDLDAVGAAGRWSGGVKLDAATDGTLVALVLRGQNVQIDQLRGDASATPAVTGAVSGLMTLTGKALSPRDLISSLTGRGTFSLSETKHSLLTPALLADALDAALRGPADALAATLRARLAAKPDPAQALVVPARTVPFEVKNGIMTLTPIALDGTDGRVTAHLAIELASMALSGTWQLELPGRALPPPPGWTTSVNATGAPVPVKSQPPLPPLTVSFTAPLAALGRARIDYGSEALEREVSVRKMERDLDDLERLRQLDDERARDEVERRKTLETGTVPAPALPVDGLPQPGQAAAPADVATQPSAVPDAMDPSLRAKSAAPAGGAVPQPTPATKPPSYRPLSQEENRRIFGGG